MTCDEKLAINTESVNRITVLKYMGVLGVLGVCGWIGGDGVVGWGMGACC